MALVHACSICKAHLLCRCLLCSQLSVCFRQACNWHFKFFPRNVFLSCVITLMAQHGVVRTRGTAASVPCSGAGQSWCVRSVPEWTWWGWTFLVCEKCPWVDMVGPGSPGAWEVSPSGRGGAGQSWRVRRIPMWTRVRKSAWPVLCSGHICYT